MSDPSASGSLWFAELHYLRLEALDLLEKCLREGQSEPFELFVDRQITEEPPRLDLLREVADDLHQRLQTLRESHYAVRDQALRTLHERFGVDLIPFIPLAALESYHHLDTQAVLGALKRLGALSPDEQALFVQLLSASVYAAADIHREVRVTEHLYTYVMDWTMGMSALIARRSWQANDPRANDQIH